MCALAWAKWMDYVDVANANKTEPTSLTSSMVRTDSDHFPTAEPVS
jgi:hypothetical protein